MSKSVPAMAITAGCLAVTGPVAAQPSAAEAPANLVIADFLAPPVLTGVGGLELESFLALNRPTHAPAADPGASQ